MSMKFRAHDTFFIRKGWLSKGMERVVAKNDLFIDKNENPMDILGIGSNMVKALRYWLQVVGLTSEPTKGKRVQNLTEMGEVIYYHDRYIEELGTLYLLQYQLAKQKQDATAWYYLFNEFTMKEFSKDDFVEMVDLYTQINGSETARSSLEGDFDCLMNTYVSRIKSNPEKVHPENNIDCPIGELNLVDIVDKKKKIYRKAAPKKGTLNPLIVLSVIVDQANINESGTEIKINTILTDKNNAGKIFSLDVIALTEMLYELQKLGYIKVNRTAGLDVIKLNDGLTFDGVVKAYYESLSQ